MKMIASSIALAAMSGAVQAGITVKSADDSGDKKELITADPEDHTYSTASVLHSVERGSARPRDTRRAAREMFGE
jgi:hypothetical protein